MGSVIKEIEINAPADVAWLAVSDVGNVHKRLVPGFVVDTSLQDGVRTVTFANGTVLREAIVSIDPSIHRIAYASIKGRASHHNSSLQVIPVDISTCRLIRTTDALPDEVIAYIESNMEAALPIMKLTIEGKA